jgi:LysR family hydrogen peroxide-inducible transcriptional activator
MTIIKLEYLIAVANCGSFSLASQQSFVTQPSLSMQIKALEEELGVILLERTKKPVIPTEAGEVVIRNAREALKAYNYVRESVNELRGEIAGTLRLGVIPTVGPYLLHRFIPEFMRKYPKIELDVYEMETQPIVAALQRDSIDAALLSSGTTPDGIMEYELFSDRFHLYVSPSNDLYERSNIRIEDIDMRQLILLSQGHCMRDQVLELCQAHRATHSRYNFECGSLETLLRIVDCTNCVTVIPEMATAFVSEDRRGQIKTLAKGATSRKIALAVRRTYVKHSIISALREAVLDCNKG